MVSKKKELPALAILVPDGVGVKDFVYGTFLQTLSKDYRLHVFHPVLDTYAHFLPELEGVTYHRFLKVRHSYLSYTVGQILYFMHAFVHYSIGMQEKYNFKLQGSPRSVFFRRCCRFVGKVFASYKNILRLEKAYCYLSQKLPAVQEYVTIFTALEIKGVFCTHQRPPESLAPTMAAIDLDIPAITFISSWDNLSSKGRIIIPFTHYCVWNQYMKKEMAQFYPEVPASNVYVTGTNHFSPPQKILSREEFFEKIGADPCRPLLYFSSGTPTSIPNEHRYVRLILEALRENKFKHNPQLAVRSSPGHNEARFSDLKKEFPEMLYCEPQWTRSTAPEFARVIPYPEDPCILDALSRYCDVNINSMSTMSLDVACFDNPVVNIFFDIIDPDEKKSVYVLPFALLDHIQLLLNANATKFATSFKNLIECVNEYLCDKSLHRKERQEMVQFYTEGNTERANENILEAIHSIID